jgi:RecA-family ATPase
MSEHKLYNVACGYAEQGIKLLWFKLDKTPGIAWSREATLDPVKLKEWFYNLEPGQRRIGFKTGQDSRGVVVIDIDVNKRDKTTGGIIDARSVEEKKEYINETYGILPDTLEVYTPSGGRHLYYIADRPVATLKRIFPGDPLDVDSRGDGGVVVAPDEHDYITDGDFHIDNMAPLPEWLYEILARRNPLTRNKSSYTGNIPLIPEMEKAISDAFLYLDYSNRDVWVRTGHAVKTLDSDEAKRLWLEWGQKYSNHDPDEAERVWQSLNPSEITIASLFFDAKEKGYEPENVPVDILLKKQEYIKTADERRFDLKDIHDIFKERPPTVWIVDKLICEASLTIIAADAGVGKTWVTLDLATCITMGIPWLGRDTIKGNVLIVDEESGDDYLANRFKQVITAHGGSEDETTAFYFSMQNTAFNNALDLFELEQLIIANDIKFVVVDALMDVLPGVKENLSDEMVPPLNAIKKIINRTKCSFCIIHHKNKGKENEKTSYRGAGGIKGAADLMLEIHRDRDTTILEFETTKIRNGAPVKFDAELFITDFSFELMLAEKKTKEKLTKKFTKTEETVIRFLFDNHDQDAHLVHEAVKGEFNTIRNILENLYKKDYLTKTKEANKNLWNVNPDKYIEITEILGIRTGLTD